MPRPATLLLLLIMLLALLAPVIAPYDPAQQLDIIALKNAGPSLSHLLGTDAVSRDVLSRALYGARTSLTVAFLATGVAVLIGGLWGGLAASVGNRVGGSLMLVVDVFRTVPRMLLFLVAAAFVGEMTTIPLALLLGFAAWPVIARLVYAMVRQTRSRAFIEAAQATGASPGRVFFSHVVPHLAGPLTASGALLLADLMAVEAGLSFLGLGIRPPYASWGNMVQDALETLGSAWWVAAVPCACLLATVLSASAVADALQERSAGSGIMVRG